MSACFVNRVSFVRVLLSVDRRTGMRGVPFRLASSFASFLKDTLFLDGSRNWQLDPNSSSVCCTGS